MRPLDAKYVATNIENKWYAYWLANDFFKSTPDHRESYTIVIPPPNVTGVLHMGHMLNNTIQDVLVRKARLQGKNACWVPGTDHASIATEAKVVAKLKADGVDKNALSREEFLTHAWAWTDKHGGIILEQLKKLGASCDWDRTAFTMDEVRYTSVIKVFLDLYKKGKIYRGYRMVNWDPEAQTTVSDEEVLHKDVAGKLYYVRYFVEGSTTEYISVATTRPETILGDVAICVNPDDVRYANMIGKKVIVPISSRLVPIIADDYVDAEFGTGALKITPAHDINDYNIGEKHKLEIIDVLNANGTLNAHGLHYEGKDRFIVRKMIAKELEETGNLIKIEDYQSSVGTSERTGAVIEPRLSMQWFLAMEEISAPALENVLNGNIQFYPPKFINTYKYWMENVRDWCISRQLYWGHRIPAWYFGTGREDFVVAENAEEALKLAIAKTGKALKADDLRQDEDVLDTWFSSWLWPLSVFDGINNPNNQEVNYYYPTKALVTAPEILFFWVARMIIAGYEYAGQKPFDAVYLTGIVRDKLGRKMSKSLGNSPDPIDLIEKYGADGVRVGMLMSSPAGNDLPFDEDLCKQGSFFANKVWNATRLVTGWEIRDAPQPDYAVLAVEWFKNQLQKALVDINDSFEKYRMSEALLSVYKLVWDDYCSWYLEMIKPPYGAAIDKKTLEQTLDMFQELLKLMHPFMPFITEEIWQSIRQREENSTIMYQNWPEAKPFDAQILAQFAYFQAAVTGIRTIRKDKNIAQKEPLELHVLAGANHQNKFDDLLQKLCNINTISQVETDVSGAFSFTVGATVYFIPSGGLIDVPQELERIAKEIVYQQGFLQSVMKKLGNQRFVASAPPEVVAAEQKKREDAESKIAALTEQMAALKLP